jgi:hypothetical protein
MVTASKLSYPFHPVFIIPTQNAHELFLTVTISFAAGHLPIHSFILLATVSTLFSDC